MKQVYTLLLVLFFSKLYSQLANGYIKISALHKGDFIQNTDDVKYKYSFTNAVFVALQLPVLNKETKTVTSSFEIGLGYAQFIKNASSYVMRSDTPYIVNIKASKQDFYFDYNKNVTFYAQFNKHIKKRLSYQFGLMYLAGGLSSSNVFSKPTYSGITYSGGGHPGYTIPSFGYNYSSKIRITTLYTGISYYLYKNVSVSADIAINFNSNSYKVTYPVGFTEGIDHSLQTAFISSMLKLSYCFLPKK